MVCVLTLCDKRDLETKYPCRVHACQYIYNNSYLIILLGETKKHKYCKHSFAINIVYKSKYAKLLYNKHNT